MKSKHVTPMAGFMWLITSLLYAFQFFMRSSPNPMQNQIIADFGITTGMFGVFSSMYYWPYALLQIPVGISLDVVGPKKMLRIGSFVCCLGTFIFALSPNFFIAAFGRFVIGLGASAIFISAIRLNTLWIPKAHLAFAIGSLTAMGKVLGSAAAMVAIGALIEYMPHIYMAPWHYAILCLGGLCLLITVAIWLFVRNGPEDHFIPAVSVPSVATITKELLGVLKKPGLWAVGIYGYGLYLALSVLGDTFSIGFLCQRLPIDLKVASELAMLLPMGSAAGAFLLCFFSDRFRRRRLFLKIGALGALFFSIIVLFGPTLSPWTFGVCFFFMGFFAGGQSLIFIVAVESVEERYAGMALGVVNGLLMLGGALQNPLVGSLLGLWGKNSQGLYPLENYQLALSTLTVMFFVASVISFYIKDSHPSRALSKRYPQASE